MFERNVISALRFHLCSLQTKNRKSAEKVNTFFKNLESCSIGNQIQVPDADWNCHLNFIRFTQGTRKRKDYPSQLVLPPLIDSLFYLYFFLISFNSHTNLKNHRF
jgi:hypothetical protein